MTMIGVIYSAKNARKVNDVMIKNQMDNIASQIKTLEVKQDKHNSTIERTFLLEKQQAETSRDIKTLYNHVDEIKCDVKDVRNDIDMLSKNVNEVKECEIRLESKVSRV